MFCGANSRGKMKINVPQTNLIRDEVSQILKNWCQSSHFIVSKHIFFPMKASSTNVQLPLEVYERIVDSKPFKRRNRNCDHEQTWVPRSKLIALLRIFGLSELRCKFKSKRLLNWIPHYKDKGVAWEINRKNQASSYVESWVWRWSYQYS